MSRRLLWATAAVAALAALWAAGRPAPGPSPAPPEPAAVRSAARPESAPDFVQLAAVQMRWRLEDYATPERFAARVDGLMRQVSERLDPRYPALVAFPEDVGILAALVGEGDALKGAGTLEAAVERMVRRHLPAVLWNRARHRVSWPRAVFLTRHETMAQTYLETFSAAAKKYGVYLVAGSIPLPDYDLPADGSLPRAYRFRGGAVYNASYVFGPDGRILGRQKKVHLIDLEGPQGLDLVPGRADDIRVIDTPLGRIGIAICLDAFHDDVLSRLQEQGARILVQPSANPEQWTPAQQVDWLNGSWKAVVEGGRFDYAVNPMMAGHVLDLGFFGQSSIIAREGDAALRGESQGSTLPNGPGPVIAGYTDTGPRPGFLAVADTADREEVLVVKVPRPAPR